MALHHGNTVQLLKREVVSASKKRLLNGSAAIHCICDYNCFCNEFLCAFEALVKYKYLEIKFMTLIHT